MVGADARRDDELELLRLGDALGGHIGRPEGLGDDHLGIGEFIVEGRVRAVLVGGHDQSVASLFKEFAQAQLPGHAAQKLAWFKVDGARRRRGLAIGIMVDLGNVVSRRQTRMGSRLWWGRRRRQLRSTAAQKSSGWSETPDRLSLCQHINGAR